MLIRMNVTVRIGLQLKTLSSHIPASNAENITISVRPATQTTVKVTAVLNSSCPLLFTLPMAAKLYHVVFHTV